MGEYLSLAREFVEITFKHKNFKFRREHYAMFLISNFMLFKEAIIKRDARTNIMYFDYDKCEDELDSIRAMGEYVLKYGIVKRNGADVILVNHEHDEELESYIWIFAKVRDAIAHGIFSLDIKRGLVIIDNENIKTSKGFYTIKCDIPLRLFEYLYATSQMDEVIGSGKSINEIIGEIREEFNYIDSKDESKYSELIDLILKSQYAIKKDANIGLIISSNYNNGENIKMVKYDNYRLFYSGDNLYYVMANKRKNKILSTCRWDNIRSYMDVLKEIGGSLEIVNENSFLRLVALYNYMLFTLCNIDYHPNNMNFEEKKKMAIVLPANMKFWYLKQDEKSTSKYHLECDEFAAYYEHNKSIEANCRKFIEKEKKLLKTFIQYPNDSLKNHIIESYNLFFKKIVELLANRNYLFISSIRNAIVHSNFYDLASGVEVFDKTDARYDETIKFDCISTEEEFYEMTKRIENIHCISELEDIKILDVLRKTLSNELCNEALFKELRVILDLIGSLNGKIIYEEAPKILIK